MAHIEKRVTAKGVTRYRAQIILKGHPRLSETFSTRREATRWADRTTEAMRQRVFQPEAESEQRSIGDLVDRYILDKLPQLSDQPGNRRKLNWWRDQLGETVLVPRNSSSRCTRLSVATPPRSCRP